MYVLHILNKQALCVNDLVIFCFRNSIRQRFGSPSDHYGGGVVLIVFSLLLTKPHDDQTKRKLIERHAYIHR